MPLQYAEKINATRSGMARAAAASGRDHSVSVLTHNAVVGSWDEYHKAS